jgi:cytochrome c
MLLRFLSIGSLPLLALAVLAGPAAVGQTSDADAARTTAKEQTRLVSYGRHLSQECTACHRNDGVDNGIPSIAGLEVEAFIRTVKSYQDGARTNPVMVSVARSLDEEQVRALAAYWASVPRHPETPPPKMRM